MTDYFLFARPSFISGMGRVLDLGSTLTEYNVSPSEEQADHIAIRSDWEAVGSDITKAIAQYEKEKEPPST